jgi:hypothetical protein
LEICIKESMSTLVVDPIEIARVPPTEPDPNREPKPDPEREPGADPDLIPALDPEPEPLPM